MQVKFTDWYLGEKKQMALWKVDGIDFYKHKDG